jgi:hypothetical protein
MIKSNAPWLPSRDDAVERMIGFIDTVTQGKVQFTSQAKMERKD